jgi:hypothetical protein
MIVPNGKFMRVFAAPFFVILGQGACTGARNEAKQPPPASEGGQPSDADIALGTDGSVMAESDSASNSTLNGCIALPPLPAGNTTEARLWFSSSGITSVRRARVRDSAIYVAANPPLRMDWQALSVCPLPGPSRPQEIVQDILAPASTSLIVIVYGVGGSARVIRVSMDDGRTWTSASDPGLPGRALTSVPSLLEGLASQGGRPGRLFATYGGTTLDVSDNGGVDWSRVFSGGQVPAQGFVVDSAGETLWYVGEGAPDRVAAYWMPVSAQGSLPSSWSMQVLAGWDGNTVYSAHADPFDPHAIYIGGAGRLGYLNMAGGQVIVDVRWALSQYDAGQPYTHVTALWADPQTANHIILGGGPEDGAPAQLLESTDGGRTPQEIALEGRPQGTVRAIQRSPTGSMLLVFLERASDSSLGIYVINR